MVAAVDDDSSSSNEVGDTTPSFDPIVVVVGVDHYCRNRLPMRTESNSSAPSPSLCIDCRRTFESVDRDVTSSPCWCRRNDVESFVLLHLRHRLDVDDDTEQVLVSHPARLVEGDVPPVQFYSMQSLMTMMRRKRTKN